MQASYAFAYPVETNPNARNCKPLTNHELSRIL